MKIKEVLDKTVAFFKDKNLESPRLDAELIIANALGVRRLDLYLKFDQPLSEIEMEKCRSVVRRRVAGEPVAYILGEKEFFGLTFRVNKNVLIPRPETELLVEAVLDWEKQRNSTERKNDNLNLLDLGAGTGCIGLSILNRLPTVRATFVDKSDLAMDVVSINANLLGLSDRSELVIGDASNLDLGQRTFDIIVANPPYIAEGDQRVEPGVHQFEPHLALYAQDKGMAAITEWSTRFSKNLSPGGVMAFEFGIDQSQNVKEHFSSIGVFESINIIKDYSGIDRHIIAIKKS